MQTNTLRITEIFHSLQGEAKTIGLPTTFIRLTGCPLRCAYCDTTYAFSGGTLLSIEQILTQTAQYGVRHVCVTGGEPLAQPDCLILLQRLCDLGYEVSLETSGALDVSQVDARVSRVVDLKTPSSGEVSRNRYENLPLLTTHDQVKFVICSREDYDWSVAQIQAHGLAQSVGEILFSPAWGLQCPQLLADWIVNDRLPVRFQLQLHKLLWSDERGH